MAARTRSRALRAPRHRMKGVGARLPAAGLALALVAGSGPAAATDLAALPARPGPSLDLEYQVYAGGLHALTVETRVNLGSERYEAELQLRTDGWLAWLLDFSMASRVQGRADDAGLQPDRFRSASSWEDRERSVEVAYRDEALPRVEAVPPPEEDDRDPVPEGLRRGTVDPLSAGLALVHRLVETARCGGEAAVFDGRRLFAASARHIGEASLAPSGAAPYGGPSTACLLTVKPISGFWKKQDYKVEPRDVTVYFRPVLAGGPPVPVRVEADTRFGAVRVHLVDARILP